MQATTSGYCGGKEKNPTYEQVSSGRTGHIESMQVRLPLLLSEYDVPYHSLCMFGIRECSLAVLTPA